MNARVSALLSLAVCGCLQAEAGQSVQPANGEKLGRVDFPVSCGASQQASINRRIALLHDFWYEKAERHFQAISAADHSCAMAYWGEAMTWWHEIWDRPDAVTCLDTGRGVLERDGEAARDISAGPRGDLVRQ
jgi:hypothetical protein